MRLTNYRYFYWPKSKFCCHCSPGNPGLSILKPDWLSQKATYKGETTDGKGYKFYQHMDGGDELNIVATKDDLSVYSKIDLLDGSGKGLFRAIDNFHTDTLKTEFDDSVFNLPEGDQVNGSCYVTCPAGGIC